MNHYAGKSFWDGYNSLPQHIRDLADRNFQLLKENPSHPSLRFRDMGRFRSARVGRAYRALAVEVEDGYLWFWIGNHDEYERIIDNR